MATHYEVGNHCESEAPSFDGTPIGLLKVFEDLLIRMQVGIVVFVFSRLPCWVYEFLVYTAGPFAVRLVRVAGLIGILLATIFGPMAVTQMVRNPWPGRFAMAWCCLALLGAVWGSLFYVRRKRRAAAALAEPCYPIAEVVNAELVTH